MRINNENKKTILLSFTVLLIICIPSLSIINYKTNNNFKTIESSFDIITSKNLNDSIIKIKAGSSNSHYLQLEDDPNAEDAFIISEDTNDLIKGCKHFPIRNDKKKVVYLTFDDGPSTTNTPNILKILDKYNIKATFFVVGCALEDNDTAKDLLKEIAKSGHSIGNHTYSHNYHYLYPGRTINTQNVINDLNKNLKLMQDILGKDFYTRIVRLPGGYRSWNGKKAFKNKLNELGIVSIDWNALNGDAEGKNKNPQELLAYLKNSVKKLGKDADSIVVLMHDTYGKSETVKALPKIIEYFRDNNFEFKTIK